MAKVVLRIEANNIGPHTKLKTELENESCKIGLYANNGSGKTFLSRAFRLYSKAVEGEISGNDINKMLSFGADKASFKFDVENKNTGILSSFKYDLLRDDKNPSISLKSNYIFHVFNKDYVDQNLETCGYSPSGEIEGYILGKDKIDLSNEEEELKRSIEKLQKLKDQINVSINAATSELKTLGIKAVTTEFKQINFETIVSKSEIVYNGEFFEVLKDKQEKLKSMPSDLLDAVNFALSPIGDLLGRIETFLKTKINKSTIAEDFKDKVKNKQLFIENGVKLVSNNQCPFCEQELSKNAFNLVDLYNQYLDDAESQEAKKAINLSNELDKLYQNFGRAYSSYNEGAIIFNQIREYLPSADSLNLLEVPKPDTLKGEIETFKKLLKEKSINISLIFSEKDYKNVTDKLTKFYQELEQIKQENDINIEKLNFKKSKIQQEKSVLNKQLCISKMNDLKKSLSKHINNYQQIRSEIVLLENDIKTKRNKHKKERKDEVMKTFEECLQIFFGDKYSFDKKKFCLRFKDNILKRNATDVLSDGEKSIVAFCFYLADTHRIIKDDDDYSRLFFIIDDPISSMDFHYVYSVSQCIKSLNKYFPLLGNRQRFLILTHNLEFISILGRNKICTNNYYLSNGSFIKAKGNSALPYEEHLRDVLKISKGEAIPSHTTPNSIRHILETINKFKSPNKDFSDFFTEIDELKTDPFLYSLIHDHSHGALRSQPAYTPEQIKKSCDLVIGYIQTYFEGQIRSIDA